MELNSIIIQAVIIFIIVLFSSFIHSSTGFGFAVFSMTLLTIILPLASAVAVVRLSLLVLTAMMVVSLWKHINWRFIVRPTIFTMVGNTVGFYLLIIISAGILSKIMGGVLIVFAIYLLKYYEKIIIKKSKKADVCIGLLAGVLNGMFNLGGIVLVTYFLVAIDDKLEYASSLQANFVINALFINILGLIAGDFSSPGMIAFSVAVVIAVVVGSWFGLKVLKKINKELIGKLSYSYMLIMGVIMLIKH
ncbi:sulfite exporter TauE/SafE family protein [Petroclostridium sp. X23]|uniref:sulfite exporter TauE/SafE family protein n=1 Tax=Petroclostridium sp. X23 TaxID=3045146 RepID=UPI0024AE1953|nr:sulfite exporter TauE/SafE family protein [Petroclostridium sp. X23]WHH56838.1 sulfite exporter TauE/SafE family protein [Petroclostridium sp. X23]